MSWEIAYSLFWNVVVVLFFSVSPVAISGKQMLIFFVSSWEQCINLSRLGLISLWRSSSQEESQHRSFQCAPQIDMFTFKWQSPLAAVVIMMAAKEDGWVGKKENPILSIITLEMASDQKTPLSVIESMDQQPILFFALEPKAESHLSTFRPVLWLFFYPHAPAIEAERIMFWGRLSVCTSLRIIRNALKECLQTSTWTRGRTD